MILGKASACRGNPPAPCDTDQNVLTVPAPQQRHPHTPRAADPWTRPVSASLLLQGAATAETEIIQREGKQEERIDGMTEQVWKNSQWNKSKGQKTELRSFIQHKKRTKTGAKLIYFSLFSSTAHQVENKTVLGWYKLSGQTKHERSLNSELAFTAKALVFTSCNESTLVVLR